MIRTFKTARLSAIALLVAVGACDRTPISSDPPLRSSAASSPLPFPGPPASAASAPAPAPASGPR
jgi:hypothetical protein